MVDIFIAKSEIVRQRNSYPIAVDVNRLFQMNGALKEFQFSYHLRLKYRTVQASGGVWDGTSSDRSDCLSKFVEEEEEEAVLP